ncbi:hypothetical protein HELRODRAFT_185265 [Helobdella robusta]|uniref:Beta-catenin-interacting ICAT domain-containing protein n=1 Tax=Helobdella robusta TaxID=6412 RepID=T1FML0_HELRO|nr:hypothetical protein HELRODRAFT_185265 [Helobdella robusta]ESO10700.1 hypothetical protein HELRODRAFT_185265 [Helobdella robusta]
MASSRGQLETSTLKQNMEDQLDRLMEQLADIEQSKNDLDPCEYEEMKNDTMEQLSEFNLSLTKMKEGNLSLVDDLNNMQLAIQAAISQAFKTPEVIKMFAKKQPNQLRECLQQVERNLKINQISQEDARNKKVEVLTALKKLKEPLSSEEEAYLAKHSSNLGVKFQKIEDDVIIDGGSSNNLGNGKVLKAVKEQVKASSINQ